MFSVRLPSYDSVPTVNLWHVYSHEAELVQICSLNYQKLLYWWIKWFTSVLMAVHDVPYTLHLEKMATKLYLGFWVCKLAAKFPGPVDQEHLARGLLWQGRHLKDEQWHSEWEQSRNQTMDLYSWDSFFPCLPEVAVWSRVQSKSPILSYQHDGEGLNEVSWEVWCFINVMVCQAVEICYVSQGWLLCVWGWSHFVLLTQVGQKDVSWTVLRKCEWAVMTHSSVWETMRRCKSFCM